MGHFGDDGLLRDLFNIVADDLAFSRRPASAVARAVARRRDRGERRRLDDVTAEIVAAVTDRINQAVTDGNLTQERADQVLANLTRRFSRRSTASCAAWRRVRCAGAVRSCAPMGQRLPRVQQFMDNLDARAPLMNAIMDATGLNGRELAQQLRSGSTLSESSAPTAATRQRSKPTRLRNGRPTRLDEAVTQRQSDAGSGRRRSSTAAGVLRRRADGAFRPAADPRQPAGV